MEFQYTVRSVHSKTFMNTFTDSRLERVWLLFLGRFNIESIREPSGYQMTRGRPDLLLPKLNILAEIKPISYNKRMTLSLIKKLYLKFCKFDKVEQQKTRKLILGQGLNISRVKQGNLKPIGYFCFPHEGTIKPCYLVRNGAYIDFVDNLQNGMTPFTYKKLQQQWKVAVNTVKQYDQLYGECA